MKASITKIINQVKIFGQMVKFSHTIFALPFAMSSFVLSLREVQFKWISLLWILIAMVGARSSAMGFNRIIDSEYDLLNPRTNNREIPQNKISKIEAFFFVIIFSILFIMSSAMISKICFILSFPVLFLLLFYSYAKRFTNYCHIYLGFVISLAPLGTWIAMTGKFSFSIVLLSLALMTYIAGFDILYACLDIDFDKKHGLYSIPVEFGLINAMRISSLLHIFSFIFFITMYFVFNMSYIYLISIFIIGTLYIWEHILVDPTNLDKIDFAFYNINAIISVILFLGILGDEILRFKGI